MMTMRGYNDTTFSISDTIDNAGRAYGLNDILARA